MNSTLAWVIKYALILSGNYVCIMFIEGFREPTEESLINILDGKKGNVAVLMVGGVSEAFQSFPGPIHLVANKRKGFVRVALKTG